MATTGIDEFAEALVREVRDAAISMCTTNLDPTANSVVAQRWRKASQSANREELLKMIIADAVDGALFHLLFAIDDEHMALSFRASGGEVVDLAKDGSSELAGWYMGSDGWRAQYSKELYIDDFADLA